MFKTYLRLQEHGTYTEVQRITVFTDKEGNEQTEECTQIAEGTTEYCEEYIKWYEDNGAEIERIVTSGMTPYNYYD